MMFSGANAVFLGEQLVGTFGDFEFALASEGLRLSRIFVDATDDERRAVGTRQRADALEFFLAIFEIDRS